MKSNYPDIGEALGPPIQVNGVGNYKLCADLSTMLRILWLLPTNPRTAAFRLKCAEDILRQMKGDPSLVAELQRNRALLQETNGVHFCERSVTASALNASVTRPVSDTDRLNLVRLLPDALRMSTEDAVHQWTRALETNPQLARCLLSGNDALVDEVSILAFSESLPESQRTELIGKLHHWRVSGKRGALGDFCPVMRWACPHKATTSEVVWVHMPRLDGLGWWVDVDDLLAKKYALSKAQAAKYRTRCQDFLPPGAIESFQAEGRTRWICTMETARRLQLKTSRKKDAEAERMYEHSLAQTYVREGLCQIEVVCGHCTKKTPLSSLGKRTCELGWKGYRLDVGIVMGGEVVGAIEIRNTSAISEEKMDAFRTEGLQWAEVAATDVIAQIRNRAFVVAALRGGGICASCGHSETRTSLATKIAELESCRTQALKRRAAAEEEIAQMESAIQSARDKIARLN